MEPITDGAIHTVDRAADFGPEVFLAVVVIILFSAFMYLMLTQGNKREERMAEVVDNNTRALAGLGPILDNICNDVHEHDKRTAQAVQDIHDLKPVIDRVDRRIDDIHRTMVK